MRAWLERTVAKAWMHKGVLACLLYPLSLLTRRVVMQRALQQPAKTLPVPVIVVGNIFVGGTGKTPFTLWLVQSLRQVGYTPGVISRGYGRNNDRIMAVSPDASASAVGDEPLLIAQRAGCPVYVGRQRVEVANVLLNAHPDVDVIISDDGLQHYALPRQVEIILMDQRGVGNGWLLPAGPLREPVSRQRDFTVCNVGTLSEEEELKALGVPQAGQPYNMVLQCHSAQQLQNRQNEKALSEFVGHNILAVAGIGHPQRFFTTLKTAGLDCDTRIFPDHHVFTAEDFLHISADIILITEKDAVKCQLIDAIRSDPRIWVVPVKAEVNCLLQQQIVEKLSEFKNA